MNKMLVKWRNEPVEEASWEFLFDFAEEVFEFRCLNLVLKVLKKGDI